MNYRNVGDRESAPRGLAEGLDGGSLRHGSTTAGLVHRSMHRSMTLPPERMAETLSFLSSSSDSDFNPVERITGRAAARHQRKRQRHRQHNVAPQLKPNASLESVGSEQPLLSESEMTSAFRRALRWACLDLSTPGRRTISLVVAFVLGVAVPILRHCITYCSACRDETSLKFQSLVLILEGSLFIVSYVFAWVLLSDRSQSEILFLDSLENESDEFRANYARKIKKSFGFLLAQLLIAPTAIYVVGKVMWYCEANLSFLDRLLPEAVPERGLIIRLLLFITTTLSWLYQTVVFLIVCCIFWLLCNLHVLKLLRFSEHLRSGKTEMAVWILEHRKLRLALREISHRFRSFLVLTSAIILFGTWSSIYSLLHSKEADLLNAGDLSVCNFVHLMGGGLCLRAAAKITHRAQSIVGLASQMQARLSSIELGTLLLTVKSFHGLTPSVTHINLSHATSPTPDVSNPSPVLIHAMEKEVGRKTEDQMSYEESEGESQDKVKGLDIESGLDQINAWAESTEEDTTPWGGLEDSVGRRLGRGGRRRLGLRGRRMVRVREPGKDKWGEEKEKFTEEEERGRAILSGEEFSTRGDDDLERRVKAVEAWCQRQALVAYLHHTRTGISVYGFVLDRAFVYSSLGLLCTSTFFVITRSLGAA